MTTLKETLQLTFLGRPIERTHALAVSEEEFKKQIKKNILPEDDWVSPFEMGVHYSGYVGGDYQREFSVRSGKTTQEVDIRIHGKLDVQNDPPLLHVNFLHTKLLRIGGIIIMSFLGALLLIFIPILLSSSATNTAVAILFMLIFSNVFMFSLASIVRKKIWHFETYFLFGLVL